MVKTEYDVENEYDADFVRLAKRCNPCASCGSKAKIELFTVTIWILEEDFAFPCCSNKKCEWYWSAEGEKSCFGAFDKKKGEDKNGHRKKLWDYAKVFSTKAEDSSLNDGVALWNRRHPKKKLPPPPPIPEKVYDPIGSLEL